MYENRVFKSRFMSLDLSASLTGLAALVLALLKVGEWYTKRRKNSPLFRAVKNTNIIKPIVDIIARNLGGTNYSVDIADVGNGGHKVRPLSPLFMQIKYSSLQYTLDVWKDKFSVDINYTKTIYGDLMQDGICFFDYNDLGTTEYIEFQKAKKINSVCLVWLKSYPELADVVLVVNSHLTKAELLHDVKLKEQLRMYKGELMNLV